MIAYCYYICKPHISSTIPATTPMTYNNPIILAFSFLFLFTLQRIKIPTPAPTNNPASMVETLITPDKYNKLFNELSEVQREIIDDDMSKYIVVAAGPGSGKTKVLVHKLASLMLLEDVKHEQLLMVTFSRAAVTEFRQRLYALIGNAAGFIEIKTFHSYCFDLIGRVGNLGTADTVVKDASQMIENGDVEIGRITKTVLVIDEAQDMDENEYRFVTALMERRSEYL